MKILSLFHRDTWSARGALLLVAAASFAQMVAAPYAIAADELPDPNSQLAFPTDQVWVLVLGIVIPALTYMLNHVAPWKDEKIKATVLVIASAVVAALYEGLFAGGIGFDNATLQLVLTAIIAALGAHKLFYVPSGISAKLGGGTNRRE